mgnify:CR=1 FL=1
MKFLAIAALIASVSAYVEGFPEDINELGQPNNELRERYMNMRRKLNQ